jgi:predicted transposase/invertase (TIGR01784 family)
MQNLEICKELLQMILPDLKIERIEMPQLQKGIDISKSAHGVRLDVYVFDENRTIYDLEMQMVNTKNLEKRIRYYSSLNDLQLLDKGENYEKLRKSYVIFICLFDLFGAGRHIYTFKNTCQEDKSIILNDGAERIFLNTEGKLMDISEGLKAFLDFVAGRKTAYSFVDKLEEAMNKIKQNEKWRKDYMTLLMRDHANREQGRQEGIRQGIINTMAAYREFDLPEEKIFEKLKEKYQLSDDELKEYLTNK